ncbi:hypothetical protein EZV62_005384 [Acer yangbiense]|uniref:Uncharacterized protein n=1 Tax=Acer yangbiense TaxID=1000413 RepID=A0A5C7IN04_9ROSI|nr:hypothetical protein EZV62_005384 [Acer yangbiense]
MAPSMARSSSRRNNSYKQIIKGSRSSPAEEASSKQDINDGCSTPKGERFRIPEILSCPPAPMKKTSTITSSSKSSKRSSSSPTPFFAPPEIELFFLFAFQNVSASS